MLPRPAVLFAVGLFAVSPSLVSYAGECKQYETDSAIAVGLLAAAVGILEGHSGRGSWVLLGLAGAAAIWFSHPALFVLAGLGTPLAMRSLMMRDRPEFGLLLG